MTAPTLAVVFAMLLQGVLALVLLWVLGSVRLPLVQSRAVRIKDIALSREPWPEQEKKLSNAFDNQFQLPVLFYVAAGIALYLGAGWLEAGLALGFVATRIVHAAIHATVNRVVPRFAAYSLGYALLIALWLDLFARLFLLALETS